MRIDVLTLFPQMVDALNSSVIGKAMQKGLLAVNAVNIRDYSTDKHKKCDDYPFGGGAGMVMTAQPIVDCIQSVDSQHQALRIFMSPRGKVLNNSMVKQLAQYDRLLLLCGHYEGVDQRAIDLTIDMEISIGDYVLTGGELPALVLIDAVSRYLDGVLGSEQATQEESFADNLLEHSQYTRPQNFRGLQVPYVLVSGNHANIAKWKQQQKQQLTASLRPDLIQQAKQEE